MALTLGEYLGQYLPDLAHLRADGARLLEEMTRERSEQQAKVCVVVLCCFARARS